MMISKPIYRNTGLLTLLLIFFWAATCHAGDQVRVQWVADGDTIVLTDGRHVRYIGIDTPEIDSDSRRAQPMGYEARAINRSLVEGKRLRLTYDEERKDRYGRTLAYVYLPDGTLVNAELVKRGAAFVLYRHPNTSKARLLLDAQREAMQKGRGIWRWVDRQATPVNGFRGNRRSMRFHAHDCPNAHTISPKNRIHLKNRWEAFWQGYAPARQCLPFP